MWLAVYLGIGAIFSTALALKNDYDKVMCEYSTATKILGHLVIVVIWPVIIVARYV